MLIVILIGLTLLVTCLKDTPKMRAIMAFIYPAAVFQSIIPAINPDYFHLIAGGFDLLVIVMLAVFFRSGWLVLLLALVSAGSIFVNYYGWMMYEAGRSAQSYDSVFLGIYVFIFAVSLMEWWNIAGASGYHSLVRRIGNIGH